MLSLIFSLVTFAMPMQPIESIKTEQTIVSIWPKWRAQVVGKLMYVYCDDILFAVIPIP